MDRKRTAATRVRTLALAALLGIAASSVLVPGAQAEPNGPVVANKPCYIPGSDLPYVTGEKATFSLNGQPAKEHTCRPSGTWTAIVVSPWRPPTAPIGGGVFTS